MILLMPCTGGVVATSVYAFDVTIQAIHDLPDLLAAQGGIAQSK
jgi:hypothetical protein